MSSQGAFVLSLDCTGVSFTLSGSSVNGITDDSCVKSAMSANGISVREFSYSGDAFTVTMAKSILQLQIVLTHAGVEIEEPLAGPAGTYTGEKDILGITINGTLVVDNATNADILVKVSDGTNVNCPGEAYKMSGNEIVLPGA
jgi:hypothetical protein